MFTDIDKLTFLLTGSDSDAQLTLTRSTVKQVANVRYTQANSASYPQRDGK